MNVLVLGGTGFIGSNLCRELLSDGEHQITVLDRTIKSVGFENERIRYIEADFSEVEDFSSMLQGIDVIYHLISTTVPATSRENIIYDLNSNVTSSLKLFQAALEAKVAKVIFLSSGGTVYGEAGDSIIPETHATNPICSYGIQKLTIEKYLHYFHTEYGMDYQIVRLANPYGKRQNSAKGQGVIPIFSKKIQQGEKIQVWGDGLVIRDYIYIDDVVEALKLLLSYQGDQKIFNLGTGIGSSLRDIVQLLSEFWHREADVEYLEARSFDVRSNILDISCIKNELQWEPKASLRDGIEKMFN